MVRQIQEFRKRTGLSAFYFCNFQEHAKCGSTPAIGHSMAVNLPNCIRTFPEVAQFLLKLRRVIARHLQGSGDTSVLAHAQHVEKFASGAALFAQGFQCRYTYLTVFFHPCSNPFDEFPTRPMQVGLAIHCFPWWFSVCAWVRFSFCHRLSNAYASM